MKIEVVPENNEFDVDLEDRKWLYALRTDLAKRLHGVENFDRDTGVASQTVRRAISPTNAGVSTKLTMSSVMKLMQELLGEDDSRYEYLIELHRKYVVLNRAPPANKSHVQQPLDGKKFSPPLLKRARTTITVRKAVAGTSLVVGLIAFFLVRYFASPTTDEPSFNGEYYSIFQPFYAVRINRVDLGHERKRASRYGYEIESWPSAFSHLDIWPESSGPIVYSQIIWDRSSSEMIHQFEFQGAADQFPPRYEEDDISFPNMNFESIACVSFFQDILDRWVRHIHVARPDSERIASIVSGGVISRDFKMITAYDSGAVYSRSEISCLSDPREDTVYAEFVESESDLKRQILPNIDIKQPRNIEDLGWSVSGIDKPVLGIIDIDRTRLKDDDLCLVLDDNTEQALQYAEGYNIILRDSKNNPLDFGLLCLTFDDVFYVDFYPLDNKYPPLDSLTVEKLAAKSIADYL